MEIEILTKKINALGLKKSHVAKIIGCSSTELSHFIHGRRKLRPEVLDKLNKYLG